MEVAFILIAIHYIADFVFQDEKWALGKSKNWADLLKHTATYSMVFFIVGTIWSIGSNIYTDFTYLFDWWIVWKFTIITFIFHTITDYFTSRWVSGKFKRNHLGSAIPNFGAFSSIGFDQVLHYAQLFLTYHFLTI